MEERDENVNIQLLMISTHGGLGIHQGLLKMSKFRIQIDPEGSVESRTPDLTYFGNLTSRVATSVKRKTPAP